MAIRTQLSLLDSDVSKSAEMSMDLRYRYRLDRRWGRGPLALFCALNPSDADGQRDDPSCKRMMAFAKHWKCGGIVVVNLFALVSSSPAALLTVADPIGTLCNRFIVEAAEEVTRGGGKLVAAWGNSMRPLVETPRPFIARDVDVLGMLTERADVYCIGKNANGTPRHPHARGVHRVPVETPLGVFAAKAPRS